MLKDQIKKIVEKAVGEKDVKIEVPVNPAFGDYSTNIALVLSKKQKKDPKEFAEEIVSKIKSNLFEKVEVAGGGFINFYLKKDLLLNNLIEIDSDFGKADVLEGRKIMFEFAHPNTHKAFHIGHLRNITTGESLSRISEYCGAKVTRANYQGDIGLHIAKAIYGIKLVGFKDLKDVKKRAEYLGEVYAKGATAYEESDKAKKEVEAINEKIYSKKDSEINKLYQTTRKWSLDYFESVYKRVYTKFDRLYFEGECADEGKRIALEALKKGILKESDGAVIFEGSKHGLHDRVFISGKGVPTYEAKDLQLVKLQMKEYDPDIIIHVLGPEQLGYTQVLFKAMEMILPETKGKQLHLPYGWVRLKKGKMSSRTGNVILGEWLLDEVKKKIKKTYKTDEETAEKIAVGAVKYYFLRSGLNQEIVFDMQESVSLDGNSGPYIQYTYARTQSVLKKAKKTSTKQKNSNLDESNTELNEEEKTLLKTLIHFPEVVSDAAENYSPNLISTYVYELSSAYNSFYAKHKIVGIKDKEKEKLRLLITEKTGKTIKNALYLLGIEAPEKM